MNVRAGSTLLTDKAERFLSEGPADVVDLIGHICNLPAAPRIVAEHMARAMFAGRPEFMLDPLGRWTLTPAAVSREIASIDVRGSVAPVTCARHTPRSRYIDRAASAAPGLQRLCSMSFAVVDVETTGGRPPGDRIMEIAAVVVRDGRIADTFETLVNPERPIPPFVSRMTRISWDMVKQAPTFSSIAPELVRRLEGSVFVAHNAAFDWKFVAHELNRATGERLFGPRLCTVRLARSILPHISRRSLDHVARYYGVEIRNRHRAGGDATATARCLIRMLQDAHSRECHTWNDLELLLGARTPGKRKRRRHSALPTPVLRDTTA